VDHPEHGELLSAVDVLRAVGYSATVCAGSRLDMAGIPREEGIVLRGSSVINYDATQIKPPQGRANFLTRKGANLLLMSSTGQHLE